MKNTSLCAVIHLFSELFLINLFIYECDEKILRVFKEDLATRNATATKTSLHNISISLTESDSVGQECLEAWSPVSSYEEVIYHIIWNDKFINIQRLSFSEKDLFLKGILVRLKTLYLIMEFF